MRTFVIAIGMAVGLLANPLANAESRASNPDLDLQVNFNMVLAATPDWADEYVQLERDIEQFRTLQKEALRNQRYSLERFNAYTESSRNEYNLNDTFRLFRQLDQKEVQQNVRNSNRHLNRVQRKLADKMQEMAHLKQSVKQAYISQNAIPQAELQQRLAAGEPVSLLPSQKNDVLAYLASLGKQPQTLATALGNPGIQEILPDNLREQLQSFRDAGVPLSSALTNDEVRKVIISNLQPTALANNMDMADQTVISIYRLETAFVDLDGERMPMALGSTIDAQIFELDDLVELYDLPVPSRDVVTATQQ